MNDLIESMTGVKVETDDGQLRSTYDILKDIGEVWERLDTKQQALLAEEIAGKNRANVFASLMQNAEQLENAYDTLKDSAGSATKEQEAYMDSLSGKINALKESLTTISMQMMNSDFLKGLIDSMTTGVNAVSGFIDTFGAMPSTITAVVGALTIFNTKFRESASTMTSFTPVLSTVQSKLKIFEGTLSKQAEVLKAGIANIKDYNNSTTQMGPPIANAGQSLLGLNAKLALTTTGLIATKVATIALQTALSMGLSLAISGAISLVTKLVDNMKTTKTELKEMTDEFLANRESTQEEIDTLEGLVSKHKQLQKELSNTELTEEQQRTKKEELIEVQRQLSELLPETATGFDEEGNKISENTDAVQKNIDKKKELATQEALKLAEEFDEAKWVKLLNSYDEQKEKVEELQKEYDALTESEKDPKLFAQLEEAKGELDSLGKHITTASELMKAFKEEGFSDEDIADLFFKNFYDVYTNGEERQAEGYKKLKEIIEEYTNSINENTNAKKENSEVQPVTEDSALEEIQDRINETEITTQSATDIMNKFSEAISNGVSPAEALAEALNSIDMQSNMEDATKSYGKAIAEAQTLKNLIEEINENGLTSDIILELSEKFPELGSKILDVGQTVDFLNGKIKEQGEIYASAMEVMIANDDNWYANNIANNQSVQNAINDLCSKFINDQGEAYNIDINNYKTLTELKNAMNQDLIDGLASFLTSLVGGSAETYARDLRNCKTWAEQKAYLIAKLDEQIAKAERNLAKHVQNVVNISNKTGGVNGESAIDEKLSAMAQAELNKLNQAREEIETTFGAINTAFDKSIGSITNVGGKGSGSGNKGSSGSSSSSKEVENMESLVDRYHDLEDAINDVNNELETNKILQDGATGQQKIKLMEKEIQLYKKQQQAIKNLIAEQKKEAQELKNSLSSQGVSFNSAGDISNYNQILTSKVNWANSLSGDAKEKAIEQVKELEEAMKSYDELVNKTIPSQEQEWESLNNTIKDVYKTQAELIADMEKNISETIEYELKKRYDAKKEALNKEKELYNKEYEEANFEEEMNTERNKLAEIQAEIDKVKNDTSRAGQLRLKQLLEEYEEQQKVINDKIKEQQNQAINDRFDEEEALLDKELEDMTSTENLSQMVAEAISTGMIKIGEETINVQNSMNDMLKETEVGFANVALQQSEWLSNLEQIKTLYSSINSIMSNAGMTIPSYDNISRSRSIGDISITTGGITITGNADSSTLGSIQDMLDAQAKEIYKNIVKKLS